METHNSNRRLYKDSIIKLLKCMKIVLGAEMSKNSLAIIGSGGHACVVFDVASSMDKWESIIILDNELNGFHIRVDDIYKNRIKYKSSYDFFVAIGDNYLRENIINELETEGFKLVKIISPDSTISNSVSISNASCVMPGVVINSSVRIGKGVIINTSASIDHHSSIGEFSHVCPGSVFAGNVDLGARCFVGTGTAISNQINICDEVTLGAGSVVVKDIVEPGTYVGVPVAKIK
jgi:sugar O-acyltransferase (sialic acid O-acetyltransferase NeuD family)